MAGMFPFGGGMGSTGGIGPLGSPGNNPQQRQGSLDPKSTMGTQMGGPTGSTMGPIRIGALGLPINWPMGLPMIPQLTRDPITGAIVRGFPEAEGPGAFQRGITPAELAWLKRNCRKRQSRRDPTILSDPFLRRQMNIGSSSER